YDDIYSKLEEIAMTDDSLREAFGDWEELSMTQEQRIVYEARLKHILDEESARHTKEEIERNTKRHRKEAEQFRKEADQIMKEAAQINREAEQTKRDAEQKDREEKVKVESIARRLMANGMEPNFVAESVDLPKEKVMAIKTSMKK